MGKIPRVDMDTLLSTSDVVSLYCPLTENTKHLIKHETLTKMKPTAWATIEARHRLLDGLVQNIQNYLACKPSNRVI